MFHDKPHPRRVDANEEVEIKENGGPGCWLVLRDAGNNGDVDLRIAKDRKEGERMVNTKTLERIKSPIFN